MNGIAEKLEGFKIPLIDKALHTLREIREEYMPAVKNEIVIVSKDVWEEAIGESENKEPNSQLAKLMNTGSVIEGSTKYCSPELLFVEDGVIARDKYVSEPQFHSKDPIKALKSLLEYYVSERKIYTSVERSKYKYYYPAGKERSTKYTANR